MSRELSIASAEDFAAIDEPGADALVGNREDALIAEDSDVMVYGSGGAGKTTLVNDLACSLAAGESWLGVPVARNSRVLLVENEGPRALFRRKLRRKLAAWKGAPLEGRLTIVDGPWGGFTFGDEGWRAALIETVREREVDVLIVGPITRAGMEDAGTLQEVGGFVGLVNAVRLGAQRKLTVVLVHHEAKSGAVSGAWEGAVDTLLHVESRGPGPGRTHVHVQKARWSSEHHGRRMELLWTDGEGFEVGTAPDERDYEAEIAELLADGKWRTSREIGAKTDADKPGIGAGRDAVEGTLKRRGDLFIERNGKDVGRHPRSTVYQLASLQKPVEPVGGAAGQLGLLAQPTNTPVGGGGEASPVQPAQLGLAPSPEPVDPESDIGPEDIAYAERIAAEAGV